MINTQQLLRVQLPLLAKAGDIEELRKVLIRLSNQQTEKLLILDERDPAYKNQTILHQVVLSELPIEKKLKVAEILLHFGANINVKDNTGDSIFSYVKKTQAANYKDLLNLVYTDKVLPNYQFKIQALNRNIDNDLQIIRLFEHFVRTRNILPADFKEVMEKKFYNERLSVHALNKIDKLIKSYINTLEDKIFPNLVSLFKQVDEICTNLQDKLNQVPINDEQNAFIEFIRINKFPLSNYKILFNFNAIIYDCLNRYIEFPSISFLGEAILYTKYFNTLADKRIRYIVQLCENSECKYTKTAIKKIHILSIKIKKCYQDIITSIEKINASRFILGFSNFLDTYLDPNLLLRYSINNILQVSIAVALKQHMEICYKYETSDYLIIADNYFADLASSCDVQDLIINVYNNMQLYTAGQVNLDCLKDQLNGLSRNFINQIKSTSSVSFTRVKDMFEFDKIPTLINIYCQGQQILKMLYSFEELTKECQKVTIEDAIILVKEKYIEEQEKMKLLEQSKLQKSWLKSKLELALEIRRQAKEKERRQEQLLLFKTTEEKRQEDLRIEQELVRANHVLFLEYAAKFAHLNKTHLQTLLDICSKDKINSITNIAFVRLLKEMEVECANLNLNKLPNQLTFTFIGQSNNVHFRHGRDKADYVDGNCIARLKSRLIEIGFNDSFFIDLLAKEALRLRQ